jgi:hypothetical protein
MNLITRGLNAVQQLITKGLGGSSTSSSSGGGSGPGFLNAYEQYIIYKDVNYLISLKGNKILKNKLKLKLNADKYLELTEKINFVGIKNINNKKQVSLSASKIFEITKKNTTNGIRLFEMRSSLKLKGKRNILELLEILEII